MPKISWRKLSWVAVKSRASRGVIIDYISPAYNLWCDLRSVTNKFKVRAAACALYMLY